MADENSTAGLPGWIPIFKGGKQTDSQGREHDGNALIDQAVSRFDPKTHEPPVTIGHPKDNAPAFGWVEGLKKQGEFLMARFKDLQPEFVDMVKRGLFKKRSASFYPDGSLRHVGFLGAAPPAVKGLPDVAFADSEQITFEFSAHDSHKFGIIGRILRSLREVLLTKFDEETANKVVDNFDIDFLTRPAEPVEEEAGFAQKPEEEPMPKTFTEEDLQKEKEQAAKEAREEAEKEFAEKEQKNNDRIAKLEDQIKSDRENHRRESIKSFTEGLKKEGKYLPAWDEQGMREFLECLDAEEAVEFSEGKKQTPLDFMKGFLQGLPKVINFDEISKEIEETTEGKSSHDKLGNKSNFNQERMELHNKAVAFAEKNNCSYEEALDRLGV